MRKLLAFSINGRRVAMSVFLALACVNIVAFDQDRPSGPPPFGDKHIGGDVPIDEKLNDAKRTGRSQSPEERVIKKGSLAPSKEDRAAFATFLNLPNTGLMRLSPREKGLTNVAGGGAYFSFANITHSPGYGIDIALNSDTLLAGVGGRGYGFMMSLGNVSLEDVAITDEHVRFIADYKPAVTFLEARAETLRFREGVTVEGVNYREKFPVEVHATYLLRSINYGKLLFVPNPSDRPVGNSHKTDVLVALRIARKEADGSVTIAWRLLKRYSTPNIN